MAGPYSFDRSEIVQEARRFYNEDEERTWEWTRQLPPEEQEELVILEQARRDVDAIIIQENKAIFAPDLDQAAPDTERDVVGAATVEVDANDLVKLLRAPGSLSKERAKESSTAVEQVYQWARGLYQSLYYHLLLTFIVVLSCTVYVMETYQALPVSVFRDLEGFFLLFFTCDFILSLTASQRAAKAPAAAILFGVTAIIPSIVYMANGATIGWMRFIKAAERISRDMQCASERHNGTARGPDARRVTMAFSAQYYREEMQQQVMIFISFLVCSVLVTAGMLNMLREWVVDQGDGVMTDGDLPLHQAIYVVLFTFSTIGIGGYGSFEPPSSAAWWLLLLASATFFVLLPWRIYLLIQLVSQQQEYTGVYVSHDIRETHIVVCGSIGYRHLKDTLQELFHVDHGSVGAWVRVVVLCPDLPSNKIRSLLERPCFRYRVAYLRGSPLQHYDLTRAAVEQARAVLVMIGMKPSLKTARVEDMKIMMQAISVLTHVQFQRREAGGPPLLVELINPSSALHLRAAGIRHVFSKEELKMGMLAQSYICPGWSSLVANLVRSHTALPPQVLEAGSWLAEYYTGVTKSFYSIEFSPVFVGHPFGEVAALIYEIFELILLAVEVHATTKVLINGRGGTYNIAPQDRAFVLAESAEDAHAVWLYMSRAAEMYDDSGNNEEAALLETLQLEGLKHMTHGAYVESFKAAISLAKCRSRLPPGITPSPDVIRAWQAKFDTQGSNPEGQGPHSAEKVCFTSFMSPGGQATENSAAMEASASIDKDDVIPTAEDLSGHLVVMGFPPRASLLEAFLRPLRQHSLHSNLRPTVVFMSRDIDLLGTALQRLRQQTNASKTKWLDLSHVYLLKGSHISYQDMKNAGLATASGVVCLCGGADGQEESYDDDLIDGEAILSFVKMSDGLVAPDCHVIIELRHEMNLRFLHTRGEMSSLRILSTLNDSYSFLWPKFAAGRFLSPSMLDSLSSQAFYRPSRIVLIEALLKLSPGLGITSGVNEEGQAKRPRRSSIRRGGSINEGGSSRSSILKSPGSPKGASKKVRVVQLLAPYIHQIQVPPSLVGHSFGELFQQLVAPPLTCIAFGLYRAKGTRSAPEPYVYTGPRADTVLHAGDKVFVVGSNKTQNAL